MKKIILENRGRDYNLVVHCADNLLLSKTNKDILRYFDDISLDDIDYITKKTVSTEYIVTSESEMKKLLSEIRDYIIANPNYKMDMTIVKTHVLDYSGYYLVEYNFYDWENAIDYKIRFLNLRRVEII